MASTCTTIPSPATLTPRRADVGSRSVGNSRLVIAAVHRFDADRRGSAVRVRGEDDA